MKKILCILIMCLIFLTSCKNDENNNPLSKIRKRGVLIAGVRTDAPPFGYIDDKTGEHKGFDIDTARYIAEKITGSADNIEFVPAAASERIELLLSGKADIIAAAMSVTEARMQFIDFSAPYYTAGQTAVVRQRSRIHTFSDLNDKTVLVVSGSTAKQNLRRNAPRARIIEYKNHDEMFEALKEGAGEAVCTDDTVISGFISRNKGYRMLKNKISSEYYAIGIPKNDNTLLKETIDAAINEMKDNGTIMSLKEKYSLL